MLSRTAWLALMGTVGCLTLVSWRAGGARGKPKSHDALTVLHDVRFFLRTLMHPETATQIKRAGSR